MKASCDSKVRQFKSHKNSTGHMTGKGSGGCVETTAACESVCYVDNTFRYPAVKSFLDSNLQELLQCKTVEDYVELYAPLVRSAEAQYKRALNRVTGKELRRLKQRGHIFRWQWAGDIITIEHAQAFNEIALMFPETSFWLYTRTWWAVGQMKANNLDVFLSVDGDNSSTMRKVAEMNPHTRQAFMTDKPLGLGVVCPATNGKLQTEGACNTCGLCYGNKDVNIEFLIHN